MMFKNNIKISGIATGHVQGIAVDKERKYMCYSFTTSFIKTDMDGNIIGSVTGLAGHLGCIAYNYEDGKVYGSLEYKHDVIGCGILKSIDNDIDITDGFYVVAFDVEKINRLDMDAENDGIMVAVHLNEVLDDYKAEGHRYGCSGIDGITFAPVPGNCEGKKYLYVAYGIYSDTQRKDNDYQVILRYDIEGWNEFAKPLNQSNMHKQGPKEPDSKYFVYTGNTTFGVQNLEYDEATKCMFMAVYKGEKKEFPNYPMYVVDMQKDAIKEKLINTDEIGEVMQLAEVGKRDEVTGIWGIEFLYGATGMISLGDGYFYFSRNFYVDDLWGTDIGLYKFSKNNPNGWSVI
ncbi:MAG: hypothetical protein J6A69_02700 [Clostridia bacterium]|nr:hypothetical protein [Clostridia bacterium]